MPLTQNALDISDNSLIEHWQCIYKRTWYNKTTDHWNSSDFTQRYAVKISLYVFRYFVFRIILL